MSSTPPRQPVRLDAQLAGRLFERSNAARWGLSQDALIAALQHSLDRAPVRRPGPGWTTAYLTSLHLEEVALARACSEGVLGAWAYFIECYRPALSAAAAAIAGEGGGPGLVERLCSDLYGLGERDGRPGSLFDFYQGRSRLATWLRAVMAQRHSDQTGSWEAPVSGEPPEPCPDAEWLAALCDGSLEDDEVGGLQGHAGECQRCKDILASMERSAPPPPAPAAPAPVERRSRWPWRRRSEAGGARP